MSERVTYLGTGIGDLGAAKRYLSHKFRVSPLPAIVVRPGARFYVTAQRGGSVAYLAGPYVSHMSALAAVPRVRRAGGEALRFAAVGTASRPDTVPTVYGR